MAHDLVIVTGASGYVATHIVQQLLQAGYKVRGTVRSLLDDKKVTPLRTICPSSQHNLELVEADLLSPESWIPAVRGCTYVIHTASPVPARYRNPDDENEYLKPIVEGTLSVLKACREVGNIRRFVLTGSLTAVTPFSAVSRTYSDEDCIDPATEEMVYPKSKALAEKAARSFVDELPQGERFDLVTVIPSVIIGPPLCGYVAPSMGFGGKLLNREWPLLPHINMNFIDVRDVALVHIRAMELPQAAGKRFLVTAENLWFKDLAVLFDKEFRKYGYEVSTRSAPYILLWIFSFCSEDARQACAAWGKVHQFDNTPMKEVLGVTPRDVRQSVLDMAHSMIDKGFIHKTEIYTKSRENKL